MLHPTRLPERARHNNLGIIMKISLAPDFKPSETQSVTISLLEDSKPFNNLVWYIRGRYGIHPRDLVSKSQPWGEARDFWHPMFLEAPFRFGILSKSFAD